MPTIEKGTKVRYSAKFLRAIGCYTGPLPFATGSVTSLEPIGDSTLACIQWDGCRCGKKECDCKFPPKVNVGNLIPVGWHEAD